MSEELQQLTDKEARGIEYYTDPKSDTYHNWSKSYLKAGYSECKGWQRNAARVRTKNHIKAAIKAKRVEFETEDEITREYCVEKLQDIAETTTKEETCIKAIGLIGDFRGYKRELASNPEKEAERAAKLSKEDKEVARITAERRTAEIAEGGHIKVGGA